MKLFEKLFKRKAAAETPAEPVKPEMSRWYTSPGVENIFIHPGKNIQTTVIGADRRIRNFPGIAREDFWVKQVSERDLEPVVRYASSFQRKGDRIIFLWQIQPDGRYWADEGGFGMTNDEEITLYAWLDENGHFEAPFRIYGIGTKRFLSFD